MGHGSPIGRIFFNKMMNRTTSKCPFEIVYTKAPRLTFDLTSLPKEVEIQEEAEQLAERIQKLHTEVIDHITKTTDSYKEEKNKKRREVHFQVGDLVMAHLKKKRFPIGTYGKIKDKHINISPIFNVADLRSYNAPDESQLS